MSYDETMFGTAPPFSFEETEGYEEKDLSASLTLRWSRKRRRWECDNAYFWHESQTSGAAAVRTADIITASAVCGPF